MPDSRVEKSPTHVRSAAIVAVFAFGFGGLIAQLYQAFTHNPATPSVESAVVVVRLLFVAVAVLGLVMASVLSRRLSEVTWGRQAHLYARRREVLSTASDSGDSA